MFIRHLFLIASVFPVLCCPPVFSAEPYVPQVSGKSTAGEQALLRFQLPGGMTGRLFAAEPMVANPVAFCFDEKGRIFVAETFRQSKGVEDNRSHMNWLLDDLAATTVADRIAMFKKYLPADVQKYGIEHDRIRRLEDTDGDGVADQVSVFADGFNAIEEGTGAGLLAVNGKVYYTCIPKLWQLEDRDDDGVADERTALFDGFGVRVAFRGHDLHGLIRGPDGRLYFSIGDRGYNIELPDQRRLVQPDQGAVFRCELDGSNLEVFCQGIRNPQELAFDDFGNLFTGDNNSDGGDRARWMYLTEGSDTGWRMYYQYLADRGPWSREKLWHLPHAGQPAYIVPPVAHFADGPSGLAYYPGTGLDQKYQGNFFLADFRGQAANSGIRNFSLVPKGASFELVNAEQFVWSILATDVEFGYDGGVYVSDWVDGWDGLGKGRIYRFQDETQGQSAVVQEVEKLMRNGFESRSPAELLALLAHPDSRIRQRAQFRLVETEAASELVTAALKGETLFARLQGIWGIGQLGRKNSAAIEPLLELFQDPEPEIRAQLSRICGDARYSEAAAGLTRLVKDPSPRVRSLAAIAVGKLKHPAAYAALLEALVENRDDDPTLRHGLVMGLVGVATPEQLVATTRIPVPAVRLAAVVALRRLVHPALSIFLQDSDPAVVAEAARAIHDLPVVSAIPALAERLNQPGMSDPVLRRVLNANFRLGTTEHAERVAAFAGNPLNDPSLRAEAISELDEWNTPGPLDRVTNEYRPLNPREVAIATLIAPWLETYFSGPPPVQEALVKLVGHHQISQGEPNLIELLADTKNSSPTLRVLALSALDAINSQGLSAPVELGLQDPDATVRSQALKILSRINPARAVPLLAKILDGDSWSEQQAAISALAGLKREDADGVLARLLDQLLAGKTSPNVELELLTAAKERQTPRLLAKLQAYLKTRREDDPLKEYRETLVGGDSGRGREIFLGRMDLSCRRCHSTEGSKSEVGPDLSRIGLEKTREYLLESIVEPNRQIARGFETAILEMAEGKVYAGIIKDDEGEQVSLQLPDGQILKLDKSGIEDRTTGKSGMPEDLVKKLTKFELRDLIEYLTTLKSTKGSGADHAP